MSWIFRMSSMSMLRVNHGLELSTLTRVECFWG